MHDGFDPRLAANAQHVRARPALYRRASGEPFARKWVRDVGLDEFPDFELLEARDGYREGVRTHDGRSQRTQAVADAGSDAFVRNHWIEGEPARRAPLRLDSWLGFAVPIEFPRSAEVAVPTRQEIEAATTLALTGVCPQLKPGS